MLARKRWVHAATCVREVPGGKIGEYVGVVQRLPSQLQRTGLGKTLERLEKEKEGSAQRLAAQHVAAWLIGPEAPIGWGSEGDLRTRLLAADDIVFGQAEDEAGEIVSWLKEAARARQAALARATGAAADGGEQ